MAKALTPVTAAPVSFTGSRRSLSRPYPNQYTDTETTTMATAAPVPIGFTYFSSATISSIDQTRPKLQ
jgi:hypothetical protein